jgi:hypothetical protein
MVYGILLAVLTSFLYKDISMIYYSDEYWSDISALMDELERSEGIPSCIDCRESMPLLSPGAGTNTWSVAYIETHRRGIIITPVADLS